MSNLLILKSYDNGRQVMDHWAGTTPEASADECELIAFRYHGKHRLGKVHAADSHNVTLVMLEDGNQTHHLEDCVYKAFSYDKMSYARWVAIKDEDYV